MSLLVIMSLLNGLTLAALLFITASGLTLSFSLMRVVNLTHGAFYMAGGFIGDRDGQPISIDVNVLKQRSLTVSAPVCFDFFDDRAYLQRLAHQLFAKIQNRTIIPAIEAFPLSQATEAHHRIESRQTMGAVVLTPRG